ncbi:MAG: glycosyltransferase [Myxococcota bacterium]|nr:glycosyltransferase [Myxococcales bacterium]
MSLDRRVSLVIPAKNSAGILGRVLDAAMALQNAGEISEILVVDDGSTDKTAEVVARHPVRLLTTGGLGPGGARNVGWRAARHDLVWFIDSDCVAPLGTAARLVDELRDPSVGGAGGGYDNLVPDSLVGSLIHEEMELRAPSVTEDSSFLRGANMLFRRSVLEELGGFDEQHYNAPGSPGAEDMEIGYRAIEAGHRLRFVPDSRVGHFHPTRFLRYLRTQRHHGYWRVWLYARHRGWVGGDSYSGLLDHLQPPWALLTLASLPLGLVPGAWPIPLLCLAALMAMQVPVTRGLLRRTRRARYGVFVPFGAIRAFARALGMSWGVASVLVWLVRGGRPDRMDGAEQDAGTEALERPSGIATR